MCADYIVKKLLHFKIDFENVVPLLNTLEQQVHDFGKQNVRRLREIQRRCKEQEAVKAHSRPLPVKGLWTSSKYQNVPSRFMVQLQVRKHVSRR